MKKSSSALNLAFFLLLISAMCATLVSGVYSMTAPIISKMEADALTASYAEVYPTFDTVQELQSGQEGTIKTILLAQKDGQAAGVIYNVVSQGYAGPIDILLAFDLKSAQLTGVKVLKQTETPGLGANAEKTKFTGQFAGKMAKEQLSVVKGQAKAAGQIEAITASTITSKAVVDGVNAAREHFAANYLKEP